MRQGNGRQKTKMEKITNESKRHVTFSKRRNGLFKKTFELSTMTKAELAIIVYSPGDKVHYFAHPSLEAVAKKFLTGNPQPMSYMQQQIQVQRNKDVSRKIDELKAVENDLNAAIKSGKDLNFITAQSRNQYWGTYDNLSQLKQSVAALKNLNANVKMEIEIRVGKQNYDASTGDNDLHTEMLPPLVGPTYNGAGSRNGLPTLLGNNLNQVNRGSGHVSSGGEGSSWPFTNGSNFFSAHGLPLSPALNVYEGNGGLGSGVVYRGCGNLPMNNRPRSSNGHGLPAFSGLIVSEFGEGSGSSGAVYHGSGGKSYRNGNSSFSPRYSSHTRSLNINEGSQVNRIGGGSFYGGASGWLFNAGNDCGLPSTNGASSFRVSYNDASGWLLNAGSSHDLPSRNGASSSGVANNDASGWLFNAVSGRGLPSSNGAISARVANNDASSWLFNAGISRGLQSSNGASSSGVANNDAGSIDRVPELVGAMPYHGFGVDFRPSFI